MKASSKGDFRKAKRNLKNILDNIGQFLPKRDIRPPMRPQQWRLPSACEINESQDKRKTASQD
jgi:hypothetical protein